MVSAVIEEVRELLKMIRDIDEHSYDVDLPERREVRRRLEGVAVRLEQLLTVRKIPGLEILNLLMSLQDLLRSMNLQLLVLPAGGASGGRLPDVIRDLERVVEQLERTVSEWTPSPKMKVHSTKQEKLPQSSGREARKEIKSVGDFLLGNEASVRSKRPPVAELSSDRLKELDKAWGKKAEQAAEQCEDLVDCSLFGPSSVSPGREILLQAFTHIPEDADKARQLAEEHDDAATRRGFTTLDTHIKRGAYLTFDLSLAQATVQESTQHLCWGGKTAYVGFFARIDSQAKGFLKGRLIVSQDGIPIGRIQFGVKTVDIKEEPSLASELTGDAKRYEKAFVSYASKDRTEVIKRVQMLDRLRIGYFQDVFSLKPGARWAQEIYRHIDSADLFLLFWSSAARRSKWVKRELDYAVARKRGIQEASPEIMPVIIEGPPPPPPPKGYEHLHFNDRLLYFMDK
jgi:hypothetical protein